VGLPGSGLSYTHLERSHHGTPIARIAEPQTDTGVPEGSAGRGVLWIALIVVVLVVAIGRMTSPAPAQVSTPPQTVALTAARAAHAAEDEKLAESKRAALGITRIRQALANSNTLKLSRVAVMPTGVICYQVHLRNSHGVGYVRTAVMDGAVLSISGTERFTALWSRRCASQGAGRDITSDVENVIHSPAKSRAICPKMHQ
jgi:hypothetical protein